MGLRGSWKRTWRSGRWNSRPPPGRPRPAAGKLLWTQPVRRTCWTVWHGRRGAAGLVADDDATGPDRATSSRECEEKCLGTGGAAWALSAVRTQLLPTLQRVVTCPGQANIPTALGLGQQSGIFEQRHVVVDASFAFAISKSTCNRRVDWFFSVVNALQNLPAQLQVSFHVPSVDDALGRHAHGRTSKVANSSRRLLAVLSGAYLSIGIYGSKQNGG